MLEALTHVFVPVASASGRLELRRVLVSENRNARTDALVDEADCRKCKCQCSELGEQKLARLTAVPNDVHQGIATRAATEEDDMLSGRHPARPQVISQQS